MASEDKMRIEMQRGARARALLDNELLKEAFESLENDLMKLWRESKFDDEKTREHAWISMRLLDNIQQSLKLVVTTGENAGKQLIRIDNPTIPKR